MTDLTAYIPIIAALLTGGGVAFYTARPKKDSLIADAADKAVEVVTRAIERQEADLRRQQQDLREMQGELRMARERIAVLEANLMRVASAATTEALQSALEHLRAEVVRLDGDIHRVTRPSEKRPSEEHGADPV
jgi:septal ring factor EnvC (AmiA/AmiB activator)